MHEKKLKGDIGLTAAIFKFTKMGWNACLPIAEHLKYDLIVEKAGECKRVQVRYTTPVNGRLAVKLQSTWSSKTGCRITPRIKGDYDILTIYNPERDEVYFLKDDDFSNGSVVYLRYNPALSGRKKGIRLTKDFLTL